MQKKDKIIELANRELARREFWHFCMYMDKKFFTEREDILKNIAYDMQSLVKPVPPRKELNILNVSLPPRTGKSYLATLFSAWTLGHYPSESIMRNSVTYDLYKKFSKDLIQIMLGQSHSNRYKNVFNLKLETRSIDGWQLTEAKQGISYFGAGVGGAIIGFGASKLSILDDSVKNAEEALNENSLNKKWGWYTSTMDSREEQGCKKLFIGTRWSKFDIVGRLIDKGIFTLEDSKSIVIPALINGESYCPSVHTTYSLLQKKLLLSDIIWEAEWQQEPIAAKGLVFPKEFLNYFEYDKLIERIDESNIKLSLLDPADEGDDFLSFGILAEVKEKYYLIDVIFTQDVEEITQPLVADMIDRYGPPTNYLEANFGGKGYKRQLEKLTKGNCYIELFKTTQNKHSKIIMQSGFIRQNFYFRKNYKIGSDYDKFMKNLTKYNKLGKVAHDDAPDMVAMMSERVRESSGISFIGHGR